MNSTQRVGPTPFLEEEPVLDKKDVPRFLLNDGFHHFNQFGAFSLTASSFRVLVGIKRETIHRRIVRLRTGGCRHGGGIGRMVVGYPKHVFSGGLALVILGLFGLNRVSVDVNVANFFKPGTEIRDSMDFMDQEMSGWVSE